MTRARTRPIPADLLVPEVVERFSGRTTARPSGCIEWSSANGAGYGIFAIKGTQFLAHRIAWVIAGRILSTELVLDHKCLNRRCVNIRHLTQVTNAENVSRRHDTPRCGRGHLRTEANTYRYFHKKTQGWHRQCLDCQQMRYWGKRKAA